MGTPAKVYHLPAVAEAEGAALVSEAGLARLLAGLGLSGAARPNRSWALKVHLGAPGRAPAVDPGWAAAVARELAGGAAGERVFACDTLSITTKGLETVAGQLALAGAKGYGPGSAAPPYLVADAPEHGASAGTPAVSLAAAAAAADGLFCLTPVRPHPHGGFWGALMDLGVGLADRPGKLELHRDLRPSVDTPLCAGCGSCLDVCLFDAITITAGRAAIDHEKCTGCGECMNVCFMAGIAPEEQAGIPLFQEKVAAAAAAARAGTTAARPAGHANLLVRLDRRGTGPARRRRRLGDIGVLASRDPVALDRATWDLIAAGMGGTLQAWSGFLQEPGPLLARAEALGLGTTEYRLIGV